MISLSVAFDTICRGLRLLVRRLQAAGHAAGTPQNRRPWVRLTAATVTARRRRLGPRGTGRVRRTYRPSRPGDAFSKPSRALLPRPSDIHTIVILCVYNIIVRCIVYIYICIPGGYMCSAHVSSAPLGRAEPTEPNVATVAVPETAALRTKSAVCKTLSSEGCARVRTGRKDAGGALFHGYLEEVHDLLRVVYRALRRRLT